MSIPFTRTGPHIMLRTDPAVAWAQKANIVKVKDNAGLLKEARPDAIKIFRHYFPDQDVNRHGSEVVKEVLAALGNAPCNFIELFNETAQFLGQGLERHVEMTREAVEYLATVRPDLQVAGFCFSTGCPNEAEWLYLQAHGFGGVKVIELHEYWGKQGLTPWNALRHRTVHDWLGGHHPPFIIGEGGVDAIEGGAKGWKAAGFTGEQMRWMFMNYDSEIARDSYVIGFTPYTMSPTDDWRDFELDAVVQRADYTPVPAALTIPNYEEEPPMPKDYHIEDQVPNWESRGSTSPRLVIIHSTRSGRTTDTDGSPWTAEKELNATIGYFKSKESEASSHLVQAANGDWWYCVSWNLAAWTAKYLNARSLQIECVQATPTTPFTPIAIGRLTEAVRWLCDNYNIPKVHIRDENGRGIIGHDETGQGRAEGKSDPGPMFDWSAFMSMVGGAPATPPVDWQERALDAADEVSLLIPRVSFLESELKRIRDELRG